MNESKNAVTVRIAGEEHVIRASAEPEHTRRCARLVDERISEIRSVAGPVDGSRAAILAALSLSDELLQVRAELEELREALSERGGALLRRVEDAVERAPDDPARDSARPE